MICALIWTADEAAAVADPGCQESSEQPDEPAAKKHKTDKSVLLYKYISCLIENDLSVLIFHQEYKITQVDLNRCSGCVYMHLNNQVILSCGFCCGPGQKSLWRQNQLKTLNTRAQILEVGRISPVTDHHNCVEGHSGYYVYHQHFLLSLEAMLCFWGGNTFLDG